MSNNYKSPQTEIAGREGYMYNQATITDRVIKYPHYDIFSNDNTYAVTFNPFLNRPDTKIWEHETVKLPRPLEHTTKPLHEPPVVITDGKYYMHLPKAEAPPLLPPYLKQPEDLGKIQGLTREKDKGNVIYGPTHYHIVKYTIW